MNQNTYNLAFVFPGQGSQSIGMLSDLASHYPEIKQTFERASEALEQDLWSIVTQGPEAELNQTQITQPANIPH
jgi:[acyl-carrier-protein] S-malonyltransferase